MPAELADLGDLGRAGRERDGDEPPVGGGRDRRSAAGARLLQHDRCGVAVGAGHLDVERRRTPGCDDGEVTVGVGEHRGLVTERRDRRHAVGQLEIRADVGRAVGVDEDDVAGRLVGDHRVAIGRGRRRSSALAGDDRLDLVGRRDRQQLLARQLPHAHRRLVDDQRAALDGVDGDVLADADAGRVGDALDAVVDHRHHTRRAVVHHDDPGRLVDVEVGARVGDAHRGRHLADLAVDVPHVARVALEQPRATVVRVGPRPLPTLGPQGRRHDRADHKGNHDKHAARHAAPGAPRHRASKRSLTCLGPLQRSAPPRNPDCTTATAPSADATFADNTYPGTRSEFMLRLMTAASWIERGPLPARPASRALRAVVSALGQYPTVLTGKMPVPSASGLRKCRRRESGPDSVPAQLRTTSMDDTRKAGSGDIGRRGPLRVAHGASLT